MSLIGLENEFGFILIVEGFKHSVCCSDLE